MATWDRNWGCRVDVDCTTRGWATAVLQNRALRVTVLVGKGDVVEVLYKPLDLDLTPRTARGLRRRDEVLAAPWSELGSFLDQYEGGWQEILPHGGPPGMYLGASFPQHGESTRLPWGVAVIEDSPDRMEDVHAAPGDHAVHRAQAIHPDRFGRLFVHDIHGDQRRRRRASRSCAVIISPSALHSWARRADRTTGGNDLHGPSRLGIRLGSAQRRRLRNLAKHGGRRWVLDRHAGSSAVADAERPALPPAARGLVHAHLAPARYPGEGDVGPGDASRSCGSGSSSGPGRRTRGGARSTWSASSRGPARRVRDWPTPRRRERCPSWERAIRCPQPWTL